MTETLREKVVTATAWALKLVDHLVSAALVVGIGALGWFGTDLVSELRAESRRGDTDLADQLQRTEERLSDRMQRHIEAEAVRFQQHLDTQRAINREQSELLRRVAEQVARLDERTRD